MLVDNKKQKKFAKENTLLSELTLANPAISIWRNLVFHLTILFYEDPDKHHTETNYNNRINKERTALTALFPFLVNGK